MKHNIPEPWDTRPTVLQGKFVVLNVSMKKSEGFQVNSDKSYNHPSPKNQISQTLNQELKNILEGRNKIIKWKQENEYKESMKQ